MRRKPAWFERSHAELDRSPYGPIGPSTNSQKMVRTGDARLHERRYVLLRQMSHPKEVFMRAMIRAMATHERRAIRAQNHHRVTGHPQKGRTAMTIREQEDTRVAWDTIASGYDKTNTATQMWIANEGLRHAELQAGMRFVDVASGSGALSIPAARTGARVLATDQSPAMLELLRARARKEDLDVETRVMDCHTLALDNDTFDMAGSQFGVMLFPDMPKGIREMARVVRTGGRVLVNAYGNPHEIDFLGFFVTAIQSVRPDFDGPPMDPVPLPLQLANPKRLHDELAAAGLRHIKVETVIETTEFRTGNELWEWIISSNPIAEEILGSLNITSDERGTIQHELERLVRERAGVSGVAKLTNPVHIGIATK
jgi:ubiquinone/menaquinone biosynthesis C-methylase UbiE